MVYSAPLVALLAPMVTMLAPLVTLQPAVSVDFLVDCIAGLPLSSAVVVTQMDSGHLMTPITNTEYRSRVYFIPPHETPHEYRSTTMCTPCHHMTPLMDTEYIIQEHNHL